jgi:hypothetical protein
MLAAAAPAVAACSDEIASLDARLDALAHKAGAASSAGEGKAAQRSGAAEESVKTGTPVEQLAKPPSQEDEKATQAAAAAGGGGASIMTAKVDLNDARNAAKKGDEATCLAAVAKAKAQATP